MQVGIAPLFMASYLVIDEDMGLDSTNDPQKEHNVFQGRGSQRLTSRDDVNTFYSSLSCAGLWDEAEANLGTCSSVSGGKDEIGVLFLRRHSPSKRGATVL